MFFKYIIIGSGPGGLGACFELLHKGVSGKDILLIEKSKISSGGLRNDCKMNFTFPVGFPQEYWMEEDTNRYLKEIQNFFQFSFLEKTNFNVYKQRAEHLHVDLLNINQLHLGTDGGVKLIKKLISSLEAQEVTISFEEEVLDTTVFKSKTILTDKREIGYEYAIIAPGRSGFDFLRKIMHNNGISFSDNSIDIGLRIETKLEHYQIVKDYYDPKFLFPENVRTFCTNSGNAHVVQEKHISSDNKTYYLVNGHSYSKETHENDLVNFALLKTVRFTEPIASGQDYAEYIANLAMLAGGGKPIMQRVGDFRTGKRSNASTFNDDLYDFEPTLKATPGDVSLVIPSKFLESIWKSLKKLDAIIPGVLHPSTIMYYPEIKLYSNKPRFVDEHFHVGNNVYLIGDGAGTSRGITGAWASGMKCVAQGIFGTDEDVKNIFM